MNHWYYFVDLFAKVHTTFIEWLQSFDLPSSLIIFLDSLIGITLILLIVFPIVMVFIWIERRFVARFQLRPGPNRCGPIGLFQPVADAIKVLLKEDIVPANADKIVHWLAPIVAFAPALMIFAVVPFQNGALLADLNIGILYIVAVSSIATVGVFMAGWGSGNKYSLLGAMRNVAAVVSYEIPLVLAIVGVVIVSGSLSMNDIVTAQNIPYILVQPLGFLLFSPPPVPAPAGRDAEQPRAPSIQPGRPLGAVQLPASGSETTSSWPTWKASDAASAGAAASCYHVLHEQTAFSRGRSRRRRWLPARKESWLRAPSRF
jgi:hypothetical protein